MLKGLDFTHRVEKTLEGSGQRTDRTSFVSDEALQLSREKAERNSLEW